MASDPANSRGASIRAMPEGAFVSLAENKPDSVGISQAHLDAVAKTLYDLRQADLELLRQQRKCRTRRTLLSLKIHYFSLARVLRNGTSHYL
jgi:hypothetical protein